MVTEQTPSPATTATAQTRPTRLTSPVTAPAAEEETAAPAPFITDEDYRVVIGEAALRIISQCSPAVRRSAEAEACEEISGYLRPRYDTGAVFSAGGTGRNRLMVMYTCDIALYHMSASLPQKMGSEVREERYRRAIKWLEDVQAGKILPDLPLPSDDGDGTSAQGIFAYASQTQLRHNW